MTRNRTGRALAAVSMFCLVFAAGPTADATRLNPDTSWMSGGYGLGFHFLKQWKMSNGTSAQWMAAINGFDVNRFADDVAKTGAKWVLFTLGQNDGYYNSPCPVINSYSGYAPGERCSNRDLP